MADYYPLIARAIAGLDPNAPGESRRALYERARSALIAQLRSVQPPLSESEITRERLSLEEAVRKVESEAAQRAREARLAAGSPGAAPSTAPRPGDALRRAGARAPDASAQPGLAPNNGPSNGPGNGQGAAPPLRQRPASPPPPARNERPPAAEDFPEPPPPQRPSRSLPPQAPPAATSDPQSPPSRERFPVPRRGAEQTPPQTPSMRGFRDITADVDDLGRATAQANRAARKTYANVPPDTDRLEPDGSGRDDEFDTPYSYDESIEEAERYAPPPQAPRPRLGADREREVRKTVRRGGRFPFKTAIVLGVVLILAGAGLLWGKQVANTVTAMLKSSPVVEAPKDNTAAPLTRPKIPDRIGQAPSSDQIAPVAQKAILYEQDAQDPNGNKQYTGTVVWRTEQIKASGVQKADIAVRADIDIPDKKFKMTVSFRRNTDTSLPASHTAELTFILPPDFAGGGIANVPGIMMKPSEQAKGAPLSGIAVKVTDGFFLIGLSNAEADRTRNIQLLKDRPWFDVPLVYTKDQRHALVAIEKGAPGDRAFNDAFAVWGD